MTSNPYTCYSSLYAYLFVLEPFVDRTTPLSISIILHINVDDHWGRGLFTRELYGMLLIDFE